MFANGALSLEVCTQKAGSVVYNSATIVGNSVVIENPKLILTDGTLAQISSLYSEYYRKPLGEFEEYEAVTGDAFCRSINFESGRVFESFRRGAPSSKEKLTVVTFSGDKNVIGVERLVNPFVIYSVTCSKKIGEFKLPDTCQAIGEPNNRNDESRSTLIPPPNGGTGCSAAIGSAIPCSNDR